MPIRMTCLQADFSPDVTDIEMAWASLTFHCLAEGTSQIVVETAEDTLVLYDGQNTFPTIPDPFQVTCNQVEPGPVGGVVVPVSKLQILAPYLARASGPLYHYFGEVEEQAPQEDFDNFPLWYDVLRAHVNTCDIKTYAVRIEKDSVKLEIKEE